MIEFGMRLIACEMSANRHTNFSRVEVNFTILATMDFVV